MSFFNRIKNSVVSKAGTKFIYSQLERYGEVVKFEIDSKKKQIFLDILLKGEDEVLKINVGGYEIISENGEDYIKIKKAAASKEWMDILISDFAEQKKFKIPQKYAKYIKMII
jgi:hypothetical protein